MYHADWGETFPADARLVILHPHHLHQHELLSRIVMQSDRTVLFLSLQTTQTDLQAAWTLFSAALHEQLGLTLPSIGAQATPAQAAHMALTALTPFAPFVLVIDAADLASEAVEGWIAALGQGGPKGSQVVLCGRHMLRSFLATHTTTDHVRLFPVDPARKMPDYIHQPPKRPLLEVFGFGTGRVIINGYPFDVSAGPLIRALFFYFIDRGMVTRDEIFETFWPHLSASDATNVFHVSKRKLSEILTFDLVIYESRFYCLSPQIDLHYDVNTFLQRVQTRADADEATEVDDLQRAIALYRGQFLRSMEMSWAVTRRETLHLTYIDALARLAGLRQRQQRLPEALNLYLQAVQARPHREDLVREVMRLLSELGQHQDALRVYDRLCERLKAGLGISPDPQTVKLVRRIQTRR